MKKKWKSTKQRGIAMVAAMIFIAIFSAFSVGMLSLASANLQVSDNHHKANMALNAALSGLECAQYIAATTATIETGYNHVSDTEANVIWSYLCNRLQYANLGGLSVNSAAPFSDADGSGEQIITQMIPYEDAGAAFQIRFYRYDDDPRTIHLQCRGQDGGLDRTVELNLNITKDATVLNYAIAGRGRMWLTGDTTIHGDIYSSWNRAEISPFNMTSDSTVEGTINTVLGLDEILSEGYQLETLDGDGNPMFDENGDRIYSANDEIQGYHEGINYDQPDQDDIPGLDIADYDTSMYQDMALANGGDIPTSTLPTETEYFPHASGNYNYPRDGTPYSTSNLKLTRQVYENMNFTNVRLPNNRNALFRNCTFNEVLYIDCSQNTSTYYNNVRFEDCNFNGVIVTDTPNALNWQRNCLYFTGSATFQNQSSIPEATILAPNFNVNLGNTNPEQSDNNVITGAVVGGIVDVRGNAQIYGTIISMTDTSQWSSGYVTNIGATLGDGGSETTEVGDIGVIEIIPDKEQMLPSGITSPIVLKPVKDTYKEKKN